jgi:GH24 family phage-related lysozyme (muramidase)
MKLPIFALPFLFASTSPQLLTAAPSAGSVAEASAYQGTAAAGIVARFERGIEGGLTSTQRDGVRQAAESYVRDRAANPTAAQQQFDGVISALFNPSVYNDVYVPNRTYFLSGKGTAPKTNNALAPAAGIVARFERGIEGGLTSTQRDGVRQAAESYVRDRAANPTAAQQQFDGVISALFNPSVYNDVYVPNRDFFLNGGARKNQAANTRAGAGTRSGADAGQAAAGIVARFERGIEGGLTSTQRDGVRQAAESYVRDRAANPTAAQQQFDGVISALFNPSVYNDVYVPNRTYFLSGKGTAPKTNNALAPAAGIVARFERGIEGGLTSTQRDGVRQAAESYVRDRAANPTAAQQQFDGVISALFNPSVYNDVYVPNRNFFLNGQQKR